jgi:hypothetical protein
VSEPASAAVCEPAARAPASVVPAFSARIGLRRATRRAIRPNARGLPNDSRYRRTRFVSGSSSHHSSRSFDETSALLPIETNAENPSPRPLVFSSSARPRAPLCDEKPIRPSGSARGANVAFRRGSEMLIPRQFGPIRRAPWARTAARSRSCRSRPTGPTSAKPAALRARGRRALSSRISFSLGQEHQPHSARWQLRRDQGRDGA